VCDPEAAHIVFSAGIPINLVPLDVTTKVRIFPAGVDRIRAGGTPYHQAVADQVDKYPPFGVRGWTHLHDPLAAATIVDPSLVTWEPLHVDVELDGRHGIAATLARTPSEKAPANCRVAMKVDVQRVEEFVVSRIASDLGE
jgi:inosine-uridine nucleoside N-ribohydrolase